MQELGGGIFVEYQTFHGSLGGTFVDTCITDLWRHCPVRQFNHFLLYLLGDVHSLIRVTLEIYWSPTNSDDSIVHAVLMSNYAFPKKFDNS